MTKFEMFIMMNYLKLNSHVDVSICYGESYPELIFFHSPPQIIPFTQLGLAY